MGRSDNLPKRADLMWPTLQALKDLGGSASIHELDDRVATDLKLTEEQLDVPHRDGPKTAFAYECGWARTHLRKIGAVNNSARGVWAITEIGRQLGSEEDMQPSAREFRKDDRRNSRNRQGVHETADGPPEETATEESWKASLLGILREMEPAAFERLCQRLLREYGFTRVEVTGRSGDGGIDGTGVLRVNLLSFHVNYQCKRYSGSVGPGSLRDFRGALAGRADKGLFITTGRFTREAEREAVREGAMAIDTIDGDQLCQLLKDKGLGVVTETVERVTADRTFFDAL